MAQTQHSTPEKGFTNQQLIPVGLSLPVREGTLALGEGPGLGFAAGDTGTVLNPGKHAAHSVGQRLVAMPSVKARRSRSRPRFLAIGHWVFAPKHGNLATPVLGPFSSSLDLKN